MGFHLLIPYIVFLYASVEFLSGIIRDSRGKRATKEAVKVFHYHVVFVRLFECDID